jgi:hypothetical protein
MVFGSLLLGLLAATLGGWFVGQTPASIVSFGLVMGGLGLAFVSACLRFRPDARYMLWQLRRQIRSRPDALVQADETGAILVEVIPRRNWTEVRLESADDLGLLVLDREKGELRFEGDKERRRIPAAAVLGCQVEGIRGDEDPHGGFVTVLRLASDGLETEWCLLPFQPFKERSHQERCQALAWRLMKFQSDVLGDAAPEEHVRL